MYTDFRKFLIFKLENPNKGNKVKFRDLNKWDRKRASQRRIFRQWGIQKFEINFGRNLR